MTMDLRAIRKDLSFCAERAHFNAWPYQPDDPQQLPAAVVGGIESMVRLNRIVTELTLAVTFYANAADPADAAAVLDLALSTGNPDSFIDVVDAVDTINASWRSIRFQSAGPYQRYAMPGGIYALGVKTVFELTA